MWWPTIINPVSYTGLRVEALYRFNEAWNALLAQSYQNVRLTASLPVCG